MTGRLLLLSELEVLAASDDQLLLRLALLAFQPQGHLLRGLSLFAIISRQGAAQIEWRSACISRHRTEIFSTVPMVPGFGLRKVKQRDSMPEAKE